MSRSPFLSVVVPIFNEDEILWRNMEALAPELSDGQAHRLRWTRDTNGTMRIVIDGRQIMEVTDRTFRQPFQGFQIFNRGGDYAFRRVTIDGV